MVIYIIYWDVISYDILYDYLTTLDILTASKFDPKCHRVKSNRYKFFFLFLVF